MNALADYDGIKDGFQYRQTIGIATTPYLLTAMGLIVILDKLLQSQKMAKQNKKPESGRKNKPCVSWKTLAAQTKSVQTLTGTPGTPTKSIKLYIQSKCFYNKQNHIQTRYCLQNPRNGHNRTQPHFPPHPSTTRAGYLIPIMSADTQAG